MNEYATSQQTENNPRCANQCESPMDTLSYNFDESMSLDFPFELSPIQSSEDEPVELLSQLPPPIEQSKQSKKSVYVLSKEENPRPLKRNKSIKTGLDILRGLSQL